MLVLPFKACCHVYIYTIISQSCLQCQMPEVFVFLETCKALFLLLLAHLCGPSTCRPGSGALTTLFEGIPKIHCICTPCFRAAFIHGNTITRMDVYALSLRWASEDTRQDSPVCHRLFSFQSKPRCRCARVTLCRAFTKAAVRRGSFFC